jgi:hypothetical protein
MAVDATYPNVVQRRQDGNLYVPTGKMISVESGATLEIVSGASVTGTVSRRFAVSPSFDLDNGAGTTIDRVIFRPSVPITITAARIVYEDATTGTVAAGNARIGTTVGGSEIVASTAYENTKAVGTVTAMTIVSGAVAAATPICVRHTGVASTQAGFAHVEIEFTVNA